MVMFDSVNRHMIPPYRDPEFDWVHAPNFHRLAQRSATFDRSYVCSMPCMPARRELHTGRPNFLHTGWGPLEPYDFSMPQALQERWNETGGKEGAYTHLATDHYHYFEDGGSTYHNRYGSWEFFRGQEGDPWIGQVADPPIPENINKKGRRQDWVNRQHMTRDDEFSQPQTFAAGLDFIRRNADGDRWFLQIECFDPHEPFTCARQWEDRYSIDRSLPLHDWPSYQPVDEPPEQIEQARQRYAALLTRCDASLGDVLDAFDEHDLWEDTMLVVWTDHGFLLGEHGCWAKNWMPLYEEISHTPFFVHDPRHPDADGERRGALVQPAIDLAPTLLSFFGLDADPHMTGRDLAPVLADDSPLRDAAIFGYHGSRTNVTDGHHTLYKQVEPGNGPLYAYTLIPSIMQGFHRQNELQNATLAEPFSFTHDVPTLKLPLNPHPRREPGKGLKQDYPDPSDLLFDVDADPKQQNPLNDRDLQARLESLMVAAMQEADAPEEQYERMGLSG